jgi:uncharacterized SAM-binding protein YcdF (DUF218 family)
MRLTLSARSVPAPALRRKRASLFGLAWRGLLLAACLFVLGFGLYAMRIASMVQPRGIAAADAIIVLTGGQDRLEPAFRLLEAGSAKRLLVSGVNISTRKADIGTALGIDRQLIACCVDLDHKALDTIGNAAQSAKWLRDNGFSSAILVTSNYHMPRALRELARFSGTARISPYPLVASDLTGGKWLVRPETLRVLATEYVKLCVSYLRGLVARAPAPAALARL